MSLLGQNFTLHLPISAVFKGIAMFMHQGPSAHLLVLQILIEFDLKWSEAPHPPFSVLDCTGYKHFHTDKWLV